MAELAAFAHVYRASVYVALNTILTDRELGQAVTMAGSPRGGGRWSDHPGHGFAGVDLPPLPLIASTQTHNTTAEKVLFLERAGSRSVILSATSRWMRSEIRSKTTVPLECFIHGALCVCQSGQCYLSYALGR